MFIIEECQLTKIIDEVCNSCSTANRLSVKKIVWHPDQRQRCLHYTSVFHLVINYEVVESYQAWSDI